VLGAAAARLIVEGRSELASSEAAWAAGDSFGAAAHARAAARAYVPYASYVRSAYRKLRFIAVQSEARGDPEAALFAWRAMRAAAIGSRTVLGAHDRERAAADAAIARLSSTSGVRPTMAGASSDEPGRPSTPALLAIEVPPRSGWGGLLLGGVALWVAGWMRLTKRSWNDEGRLDVRELKVCLALAATGVTAWVGALFLA
jgi:hypothetical protein